MADTFKIIESSNNPLARSYVSSLAITTLTLASSTMNFRRLSGRALSRGT